MKTKHAWKGIAMILTVAPLLGCESMIRAGEVLDACDLSRGGSQAACDRLSNDRQAQSDWEQVKLHDQREADFERYQRDRVAAEAGWQLKVLQASSAHPATGRAKGASPIAGVYCWSEYYDEPRTHIHYLYQQSTILTVDAAAREVVIQAPDTLAADFTETTVYGFEPEGAGVFRLVRRSPKSEGDNSAVQLRRRGRGFDLLYDSGFEKYYVECSDRFSSP